MTKQQQQQPQDGPERTCIRCGGKSFIETKIMDPTNSRANLLFRCRECDSHQWTPEPFK